MIIKVASSLYIAVYLVVISMYMHVQGRKGGACVFVCVHCVEGRYFYIVRKERMEGRGWAQPNGQSGKRKETLPMGQPLREDILPMGQWRERTGKIHIGPSALPPLYSDKIFKSSHYFTLGYSVEMPGRKPQNVYMLVHTQFWCIDSYIKISSSH